MSKIGKMPVELPEKVEVKTEGKSLVVKGPNGEIERNFPKGITFEIKNGQITVNISNNTKQMRSLHGTWRSHLVNMVKGVTQGWTKSLEMVGTGYRSELRGNTLVLTVGFSHPVEVEAPEGINFKVEKNIITVSGQDKDKVGQIAAIIRKVRPPEPYKGKGIKYSDEQIRRKAGKAAKTAAA